MYVCMYVCACACVYACMCALYLVGGGVIVEANIQELEG